MEKDRFIRFALLIGGVNKHLQRIKIDNAAEIGIKGVHAFWLYELYTHPEGMTASELASRAMIDRSLISREIDLLKRNEIVAVKSEAEGKRTSATSLSRKPLSSVCFRDLSAFCSPILLR